MHDFRNDVFWGVIAIVIVMFFLTSKIYLFPLIVAVCMKFPIKGKDQDFWENRHLENETSMEKENTRSSFSLRVDESQFWENRNHEEDKIQEKETDYSHLDSCFYGDNKKLK